MNCQKEALEQNLSFAMLHNIVEPDKAFDKCDHFRNHSFCISCIYHSKYKKKETQMFQRDKKISCKHLRNIIWS